MTQKSIKDFWSDPGHYDITWAQRAQVAAKLIDAGSSVLDIGCGANLVLAEALPASCRYTGADLVAWRNGIHVSDIDAGIFPPGRFDYVAALGVMEYLEMPERLFAYARQAANGLILSYCHTIGPDGERERPSSWINSFSRSDLEDIATTHDLSVAHAELFNAWETVQQWLYLFRPSGFVNQAEVGGSASAHLEHTYGLSTSDSYAPALSPREDSTPASSVGRDNEAIVVSYYAGAEYYANAGSRLERRLLELEIDHDIVALDVAPGDDWIDICRRKLAFCKSMLLKHRRPVFWVDVDAEVLQRPTAILRSTADLTIFLKNFLYLPKFDRALLPRLFSPAFMGFAYRSNVFEFLALIEHLDATSSGKFTDDYLLEEGLQTWPGKLRFMLLSPDDVANSPEDKHIGRAYFMNRDSGNIPRFSSEAIQHSPAVFETGRRKRLLTEIGTQSANAGKPEEAIVLFRKAFETDRTDTDALGRLVNAIRRQKDWRAFHYYVKKYGDDPHHQDMLDRVDFLSRLDRGQWTKAEELMARAKQQNSPHYPLMQSRWARLDLDRRAEQMNITPELRTPLWWMETPFPGNFGDILGPYVVEGLTGVPPKFTNLPKCVMSIGTIAKLAAKGTVVWGSGASERHQRLSDKAEYRAVRGPLTRQFVQESGGACPEIYGDPAWFMPLLYRPQIAKSSRLGIILHDVHRDAALSFGPDVKPIEIRRVGKAGVENFIDEMLSCEAVLSTSLHGVILAHAYGIPVRWCVVSGASRQIYGDGVKFEDYFASVGRPAPTPLDLSPLPTISSALATACHDQPERSVDLRRLIEAAPFKVRTNLQLD